MIKHRPAQTNQLATHSLPTSDSRRIHQGTRTVEQDPRMGSHHIVRTQRHSSQSVPCPSPSPTSCFPLEGQQRAPIQRRDPRGSPHPKGAGKAFIGHNSGCISDGHQHAAHDEKEINSHCAAKVGCWAPVEVCVVLDDSRFEYSTFKA